MLKFGRQYRLTIDLNDGGNSIVIEPPFTINFNIQRNTMAVANSMSLSIYNLSANTRSRIFQDRYRIGQYKKITLEAGYDDSLFTVYSGSIFQAASVLRGTDVITNIVSRDGYFDMANAQSNRGFEEGTSTNAILKSLASDFEFVELGKFGGEDVTMTRPVIVEGNTYENIKTYSNNSVFIDLGKVNILADNQVVSDTVFVLNADTGLLETPQREDAYLTVETLFEPRVSMGSVVAIESEINPIYNGQYKVIGVNHQGTISEAVGGSLTSKFALFLGAQLFGGFESV